MFSEFNKQFARFDIAVAATDPQGTIVKANEAFCTLTGYTEAELKSLGYQDITPERWTVYENNMIIKQVFAKGYAKYQKEYRHKDGHVFPIELEVWLLKDDDEVAQGMWGVVKPIDQLSDQYSLS